MPPPKRARRPKAAKPKKAPKKAKKAKRAKRRGSGGGGGGGSKPGTRRSSRAGAGGMAALIAVLATGAGAQYVEEHGGAKAPQFQCDPGLWAHVYNPHRFDGSNRTCTLAVGTVEKSVKDGTGDRDYHIRLRLDPGQEWMLTPHNERWQAGTLVLEVICAHAGKDSHTASKQSCEGYESKVWIPRAGDRVAAVGEYVIDKSHYRTCDGISPNALHCWGELHPVTSITRID